MFGTSSTFARSRSLGLLAAGAVLSAAFTLPVACTKPPTDCGAISFIRSSAGAFNISASGATCAEAGAVAFTRSRQEGTAPQPHFALNYRCGKAVPVINPGLPTFAYTCNVFIYGPATITFKATW